MESSLFDYVLPEDRIAQRPMEPREAARLLVLDRTSGNISDRNIADLPDLLRPGDLLVVNDSRVFRARLHATVERTGKKIELFLLRPAVCTSDTEPVTPPPWLALAKPGRAIKPGDHCRYTKTASCQIREKKDDGTVVVDFGLLPDAVYALADRIGTVPLPPYITSSDAADAYQTIYARERGSVAAPTAGLHLTQSLLSRLEMRGINRASITLHVGLGTFKPIHAETLEAHEMHEERFWVPDVTRHAILETKKHGGRVIAVGTTTARALESIYGPTSYAGLTRLFIKPGYDFQAIDGLLTNFHLPKSTLLVLVSSFAGCENIRTSYAHALTHGYRFFSFGDAMLIL